MSEVEKGVAKGIVEFLKNYVPLEGEAIHLVGARLLRKVLEEKALEILKQKYARQGVRHLEQVIKALENYEEPVSGVSLASVVEAQGEVYSRKVKGKAKKDEPKGKTLYEAFAEIAGEPEVE